MPDLVEKLANLLEFRYEIRDVADGKYGAPNNKTGRWNGMIGEVMSGVSLISLRIIIIRRNVRGCLEYKWALSFYTFFSSLLQEHYCILMFFR